MKWNVKKCITNMLYITSVIILIWMVASYVEIICKNTDPNPTYSEANLIVQIIKEANNND